MKGRAGADSGGGMRAFGVRRLVDPEEISRALALREAVFCGEQGVRRAAERDGRDAGAVHLGAFADGVLVGTCRLLERDAELVVQRVAVAAGRRRRGVGRTLIDGAADAARAIGAGALAIHAQVESEAFYQRQGFVRCGRPFLEEGIEHVAMRLVVSGQPVS